MTENIFFILILLTAVGSGLMAGVFFIFSNTIMKALSQLQGPSGIAAMQSINVTILNPLFFVFFLGTAGTNILLLISLIWRWQPPGAFYLIGGSLFYLLGVMLVTIVFNVPLNNRLDAVDPATDEGAAFWARYLITWTNWNHVRTVACLLATISFILALP